MHIDGKRALAVIKKIDKINPISNADAIEVATVGGWKVVVRKGEYQEGDLAIYCEIDSFIPHDLAPFLTSKGKEPDTYEGVKGERLRTVKLRKQISQGLLLPLSGCMEEGQDVTELLGILKWEAPSVSKLAGNAKGKFPDFIPKTDQERCQNLSSEIAEWFYNATEFEVTEKLDGSSMTVYCAEDGECGVCSRNLDLHDTDNNAFWQVAIKNQLIEKLKQLAAVDNKYYAIQGELIGEGIQGNKYNLIGKEFYLFDVYDIHASRYLLPGERQLLAETLDVKHVPILPYNNVGLYSDKVEDLINAAEGKSVLNPKTEREGLVFKSITGETSFKTISNKFLLKGGE